MQAAQTRWALLLVLATVLWSAAASAQIQSTGNPDLDKRFKSYLDSQLLEVRCDIPSFQPYVANLRRGSSPNPDQILKIFMGDKAELLGSEQIISPIWGKGVRHKSGTVLRLRDKDLAREKMNEIEVVPAFLDMYKQGFLYTNNIPHKPVYATDVKVVSELKANVSYRNVYTEDDGKSAAKSVIEETMGPVTAPKGFRLHEEELIQTFGERLFAYRVHPEYLTNYDTYEWKGSGESRAYTKTGNKPVAVKVNDVYVHVHLDADKLLAGMEHFWDNSLKPEGTPQPAINAAEAVVNTREWLVKHFGGKPPLLIVTQLTLGFVQDKDDVTKLVPAWIFGAYYMAEDDGGNLGLGSNLVQMPCPFAVNALSGEVFDL
jgi:hypothetical protein